MKEKNGNTNNITLPISIISRIFETAPSNICLRLASTCKKYRELMLNIRGCPINKATFIEYGTSFEIIEEEPFELSFQCSIDCLNDEKYLKSLKSMNLDGCELVLFDMSVDHIHQIINSVRSIRPSFLRFQRCELSLNDFKHLLSMKRFKGMNITNTNVYPPPDFDFILERTRYSHFICLKIDNIEIPEDAGYKLLYKWNRQVELEGFKLYHLPITVNLTDYVNFIRQYYCDISKRFTFAFAKNVGRDHLKNCVHQLEEATDIMGDIGFAYEHNDKLQFIPIFMYLKMMDTCPPNTCYAVTTSF